MKAKSQGSGELNGFLDAGSDLRGELCFEDTFRIDGRFTGTVVSDGDLIVGQRGVVDGEVRVARVFVSGTVKGRLTATKRVEISAHGRVFSTIETPSLVIEDGAVFNGQCAMTKLHAAPELPAAVPIPIAQRR
jgi:cytoskeletal protein CcmA (bactofilin family)